MFLARKEKVRFCPNCGSTDVEPDTSNQAEISFSGGNPNKWKCNECGYTGLMPEGNPEEGFNLEQDFEGEEAEDQESTEKGIEFEPDEEYPREYTGFGRGYLKFILYIFIPLTLIYLIYLYI
ncbi:MAG: hypothetical protein BRC28_03875 [Nanohaloarchaea archaeon SW_4_43_9]|nr:MAG: hypothetical protein BRC28_03875 [Nanohaloarchaea archaeon SW_4_43_9]